jgi:hypothetical protein
LRSRQFRRYSRISQNFMELEGSILCPQDPSTGPYPEPDESNPYHLSKINFNIVHRPAPWSSPWSLSFWLSHQYPTAFPLSTVRATCPAHLLLLDL